MRLTIEEKEHLERNYIDKKSLEAGYTAEFFAETILGSGALFRFRLKQLLHAHKRKMESLINLIKEKLI